MTISDSKLVFGSAFKSCDAVFHQKVTADLPFVQGLGVNKARWFKEPLVQQFTKIAVVTYLVTNSISLLYCTILNISKQGWLGKKDETREIFWTNCNLRLPQFQNTGWSLGQLQLEHVERWLISSKLPGDSPTPPLRHHTDKPQGPRKARRCSWRKAFWVSADGMCVAIWYQWLVSSCIRHQYHYYMNNSSNPLQDNSGLVLGSWSARMALCRIDTRSFSECMVR